MPQNDPQRPPGLRTEPRPFKSATCAGGTTFRGLAPYAAGEAGDSAINSNSCRATDACQGTCVDGVQDPNRELEYSPHAGCVVGGWTQHHPRDGIGVRCFPLIERLQIRKTRNPLARLVAPGQLLHFQPRTPSPIDPALTSRHSQVVLHCHHAPAPGASSSGRGGAFLEATRTQLYYPTTSSTLC